MDASKTIADVVAGMVVWLGLAGVLIAIGVFVLLRWAWSAYRARRARRVQGIAAMTAAAHRPPAEPPS